MITIYHSRRARSARLIWLLEELAVPYELALLDFKPEVLHGAEHLARHPLGQVPVLREGDLTMFESGAIVQYLLEQHGQGRLEPAQGSALRPSYLQWFHFGEASLAAHVSSIVRQRFGRPADQLNEGALDEARQRFSESIAVIDRQLEGRRFICGDEFSAADIMVSYGIIMSRIIRELPSQFGQVGSYLERLKERPAYAPAWQ
jgi:glutathione S-transferase